MPEKIGGIPGIHHIQIKLSDEEYEILVDAAHAERSKPTPYARDLFVSALKKEQARLGLKKTIGKRA